MIKNIDQELLQDLVKMYIDEFGYSPISAKICAYLKLDFAGEGVTFDQLQEALGVSKGSISLNLRTLIDKGIVKEINKFNDRKAYFVYNSDYLLTWFKESIEQKENILNIMRRVSSLAEKSENCNIKMLKTKQIHQKSLEKIIQQFKETLWEIERLND